MSSSGIQQICVSYFSTTSCSEVVDNVLATSIPLMDYNNSVLHVTVTAHVQWCDINITSSSAVEVMSEFYYTPMHQEHNILGYYDIKSITIINNGSSNGTVCIQCNYITGADSTGCIVSLSNTTMYNITINSTSGDIDCIDQVMKGLYSIVVYQIVNEKIVKVIFLEDENVLLGYMNSSSS